MITINQIRATREFDSKLEAWLDSELEKWLNASQKFYYSLCASSLKDEDYAQILLMLHKRGIPFVKHKSNLILYSHEELK